MSVRNNDERTGAKRPDASSPIPQVQQDVPASTFSFVTPTEFVELPSRGRYYDKDHPLHNVETIEIKHMTAREEDILSSRSLLKKGLAINRLLQSVIVDKRIDPDSLLIGDKNAILVMTRIVGYGAEYETRVTCPACMSPTSYAFDLNEFEVTQGEDFGEFKISKEGANFIITLPKTKVNVEVKLLNGKDEKFLAETINMKKKNNLPETVLTDQFRMFIVSVNGYADNQSINEFINHLPASDSRHLRSAYERVVPNIDLRQSFTCSECENEQALEVPLSADFFWPKR